MVKEKQTTEEIVKRLREAAIKTQLVVLEYQKIDAPEIGMYTVEPYSYRHGGKTLFAYDVDDKKIKQFSLAGVVSASIQAAVFKPRWPVEIK